MKPVIASLEFLSQNDPSGLLVAMNVMLKVAAVALVGGLVVTLAPSGATAVDDITPPQLQLPLNAGFVEGSSVGPMTPDSETGEPSSTGRIQMQVSWSASDPSGICWYAFAPVYAGLEPGWSGPVLQTSLTALTSDYEDQQGGGSVKLEGYDVTATDCEGNRRTKFAWFKPYVYQDDGASYGYGTMSPFYGGAWGVSNCTCWSGGTTRKTSSPGAYMQFQVEMGPQAPIALVMETAPNRGKAQIWVDGQLRRTIDTYAASANHRVVVWATKLSRGLHTIRVVNLGTPGRPRIDIDAIILGNHKPPWQ